MPKFTKVFDELKTVNIAAASWRMRDSGVWKENPHWNRTRVLDPGPSKLGTDHDFAPLS
ncbi:MAG: hypothetical protein L0228_14375 [Planctomycetes bacterium]|nr:hypothetical protein [Planctomycetota bacterium]